MPVTVQNISHLILVVTIPTSKAYYQPIFRLRNWGIQSLTNLPKVIQLAQGHTVNKWQSWNWTQAACLQSMNLTIATELILMWTFLEDSSGYDLLAELKEREARRLLQWPRQRWIPWAAGLEGFIAICCGQQRAVESCGAIAGPPAQTSSQGLLMQKGNA